MSDNFIRATLLTCLVLWVVSPTHAQRDYLTEMESEQIRLAQAIDKRIEVFATIIDRRLTALDVTPVKASEKKMRKDIEIYGELRRGTPYELLTDINRILDAAIDNLDNAATREPQKKLLSKALTNLQATATKLKTQFATLDTRFADDSDARQAIANSIELLDQILAAAPLALIERAHPYTASLTYGTPPSLPASLTYGTRASLPASLHRFDGTRASLPASLHRF